MSHIFKPEIEILGNPEGDYLYIVTSVDTEDPENTVSELYRADDPIELLEHYIRDNSGAEPDEDEDPIVAHIRYHWEMTILWVKVGEID
jgi:hypothetical protein